MDIFVVLKLSVRLRRNDTTADARALCSSGKNPHRRKQATAAQVRLLSGI